MRLSVNISFLCHLSWTRSNLNNIYWYFTLKIFNWFNFYSKYIYLFIGFSFVLKLCTTHLHLARWNNYACSYNVFLDFCTYIVYVLFSLIFVDMNKKLIICTVHYNILYCTEQIIIDIKSYRTNCDGLIL